MSRKRPVWNAKEKNWDVPDESPDDILRSGSDYTQVAGTPEDPYGDAEYIQRCYEEGTDPVFDEPNGPDPEFDEDGNFINLEPIKETQHKETQHKCFKCTKIWIVRDTEQNEISCPYCGSLNNTKDSKMTNTKEDWTEEDLNF
jgi:hypothetical protein